MSVYKVPQDVEAEDHILGPLTLKQLIFTFVFLMIGYGAFLAMKVQILLVFPFLPFLFVIGFLAAPISRQQPNEVWLAAKLHFYLKPRKRIWDQTGVSELVKIIAPKVVEHVYTDGLRPDQVQSRLQILAGTLDSRGWAVKNVALNQYDAMVQSRSTALQTDRLVTSQDMPQEVDSLGIREMDDVLNPGYSAISNKFDDLLAIEQSKQREKLQSNMQSAITGAANRIESEAPSTMSSTTSPEPSSGVTAITPQSSTSYSAQDAIAMALSGTNVFAQDDSNSTDDSTNDTPTQTAKDSDDKTSRRTVDPGIMNLARNSDLSVGTLAKMAKERDSKELVDDQVIKLH